MSGIATWRKRLDQLDHSNGTSNKMIQRCMEDEIIALRRALRHHEAQSQKVPELHRSVKALRAELSKTTRAFNAAKERAEEWKGHALRYQKLAARQSDSQ